MPSRVRSRAATRHDGPGGGPRALRPGGGRLRPRAAGARLLEIGAGTGQATTELLARGAEVDAVEPGPELARVLRGRFAGRLLRVLEGDVESVPLAGAPYDAAVSATALHWVDLERALPRLHAAIRPGGWLVAWWTVFGDPDVRTPFRDRVDEITRASGRSAREAPRPLVTEERMRELATDGWFDPAPPEIVRWSVALDTEQVRSLFTSFSDWADQAPDIAEVAAAVDACGGVVEEHYVTAVYPARRVP